MQEKSWEIKEIPTWVSQKEASALGNCQFVLAVFHLLRTAKHHHAQSRPDGAHRNTSVSRPYTHHRDDMVAVQVFSQIRTLWTNKNVVVIEGELTRFGVGNDLLNDAASVKRIIGPAKNAFEKCDLIIEEARKQPEGTIFIVALGPAAKIIAYELSNQFKTLDLGHLDIEYEWYLRKMKEGGSVPNKYVNEARVNFDSESEPFDPSLYESQIIAKFLN